MSNELNKPTAEQVEFAEFLIFRSGAVSHGSRNPSKAAELIAARDRECEDALLKRFEDLAEHWHSPEWSDANKQDTRVAEDICADEAESLIASIRKEQL